MESLLSQRPWTYELNDQDAGNPENNNLLAILNRLINFVDELGKDFSADGKGLRELRERLTIGRFHLAVLGQFKRGKSALINALIGEPLLPSSILPLTSIPTFLSAGPKRLVRILFLDGRSEEFADLSCNKAAEILANYVTEERNPENRLAVSWAEVEHPASLLRRGVVVIDTPGIGSTFRHNTEATLAFLSQCDAALFVVSADPPITDVELDFLKAVQAKVSRLFFVMNKIDYLHAGEENLAIDFFWTVVGDLVGLDNNDPVFCLSARQGLQAKLNEDEALWRTSGVAALETRLLDFFSRDKARTLQAALARKTFDVAADVTMHIRLQSRSLQLPLRDLESRIQILDAKVIEAEREKVAIGDLLSGERKRTMAFLEERAEETRQQARSHLEGVIGDTLQRTDSPSLTEKKVQERLAEEIPVFFEKTLRSFSDATDERVQAVLRPFQERVDALIETVRRAAAELFDIPYHAPDSARALESTHKPYWVTHNWNSLISPIPEGFVDRFLPAAVRYRRIRDRLLEDVAALSLRNVENVRWAMLRNLDDAFRRFASALDERLEQTIEATRGAIKTAHLRRKENLQTVETEIRRLEEKESELAVIENTLAPTLVLEGEE
jgi:GTPase SAR1 family protein